MGAGHATTCRSGRADGDRAESARYGCRACHTRNQIAFARIFQTGES
nr:MAG TPA: protein of unknown function (DUF1924) [Caudoviricetes sp.]